ncbi:hypothetical protein H4R33_001838 [Dimargaris cristalligena]|nr:hypothetical protein H4R33_001838 [Dimargaris cristalligena]
MSKAPGNAKPPQPTEEFIDIDDTGEGEPEVGGIAGSAGGGYAWEEEYKRSWDGIREDEGGSLTSMVANLQQQKKRRRRLRDTASVQRGIIRHVIIILDMSSAMLDKDLRPSRLELVLSNLEAYIAEYFDQNPLSQLGIIVTRDGKAEKITELGGNPMDHIRALKNKRHTNARGEPSLQNALEIAMNTLGHAPAHGTREIQLVFGSLTSCDPGNIQLTIKAAVTKHMRCSMVHLAAEVRVFRELCTTTGGTFNVVMNEAHFKDLLFESIPPPPLHSGRTKASDLIQMGFPKKIVDRIPTICVCPHLARSYHHIFPVPNFKELESTPTVRLSKMQSPVLH